MPSGASRVDNPTLTGDRLASIFARFTDKTQRQLNNYEARLGQRIDGAKKKLWQGADLVPPVPQMGNGYDAIFVPRCGQDRKQQPRQRAWRSPSVAAVELDDPGRTEISDHGRTAALGREYDLKPPVPNNAFSGCKPSRHRSACKFAHHEDAIAPVREAAAAKCMRAFYCAVEHTA